MSAFSLTDKSTLVTCFIVFVVVGVCNHGNFSLCKKYCVTHRTMLAFCKTCLGAGRSYRIVNNFGVSRCAYVIINIRRATITDVGCVAHFGTRGLCYNRGVNVFVPNSWYTVNIVPIVSFFRRL